MAVPFGRQALIQPSGISHKARHCSQCRAFLSPARQQEGFASGIKSQQAVLTEHEQWVHLNRHGALPDLPG